MNIIKKPSLLYNNSSGHSGSDTSKARAKYRDSSGQTQTNQEIVYLLLARAGSRGLTCAEFKRITGMDHSPASSSFTNLHGLRAIARLKDKRANSHVYVDTRYVGDRETELKGQIGNRVTMSIGEFNEELGAAYMRGFNEGFERGFKE